MDELSEAARGLIDAAMAEDEPPEDAAETGWTAIAQRVSRSGPIVERPAPARRRFPRWMLLPAAIVLAGGISFALTRTTRKKPTYPKPGLTAGPRAKKPAKQIPEKARPALPTETELLDSAEAALARGEAEEALQHLEAHALHHPIGKRADDRLVLRIKALCAQGSVTDAKAEADVLARTRRDAPLLQRLEGTCARP